MSMKPEASREQPTDLPRAPTSDPRLEIPEILRTPVEKPDSLKARSQPGSSGLGVLGQALAIGVDFLCSIAAAALIGWLIDRWRGWSPYGLLVGLGVGFFAATIRLIQRLNRA